MNREIKFRAWDKKHNRMLNEKWFNLQKYGGPWHAYGVKVYIPGEFETILEEYQLNPDECILLQYTGLKDVNGKEIYEGDIVKHPFGIGGIEPVVFWSGQVGPCIGANVMQWILGKCHNLWDGPEIEVVDNLYENPELIQDVK